MFKYGNNGGGDDDDGDGDDGDHLERVDPSLHLTQPPSQAAHLNNTGLTMRKKRKLIILRIMVMTIKMIILMTMRKMSIDHTEDHDDDHDLKLYI